MLTMHGFFGTRCYAEEADDEQFLQDQDCTEASWC